MASTVSSAMAFNLDDFLQPPRATISMAETNLLSAPTTPHLTPRAMSQEPTAEDLDEKKPPTKKRKSWGQELPTPKTNLPPRFVARIAVTS